MKNLIASIIIALGMLISSAMIISHDKAQCKETVDWSIQATSDELLQACEERIDQLNDTCSE